MFSNLNLCACPLNVHVCSGFMRVCVFVSYMHFWVDRHRRQNKTRGEKCRRIAFMCISYGMSAARRFGRLECFEPFEWECFSGRLTKMLWRAIAVLHPSVDSEYGMWSHVRVFEGSFAQRPVSARWICGWGTRKMDSQFAHDFLPNFAHYHVWPKIHRERLTDMCAKKSSTPPSVLWICQCFLYPIEID